ncbi:hypothetical protein L6278_02230, partial [Candidatus Parcubacteria bacterium]|nr:hypothetical protein [Candidatus Parcubacteria bacterium]
LIEVEEKGAESRLVEIKNHLFNDIKEKEDILDQRFAKAGKKRLTKVAIAGAMGAATAVLVPKFLMAARHSEEVRELAESVGLTKLSFLNRFFVGDVEYRNIMQGLGIRPSDGISFEEYVKMRNISMGSNYSPELRQKFSDKLFNLKGDQIAEYENRIQELADQPTIPAPIEVTPDSLAQVNEHFNQVLADSNLSDTTKTAIQDSLEKLTPEQQAKILPTITQTDTLDKTFAHTDTSEQIQKKIQELTGVKLETPKPEIIPEKITLPPTEAVVQKGEGVIHSLQRQLLADPEKFGYDKSSGIDVKDWASKIANREGMKNYGDTWVKEPGKVAYVLEGSEQDGFNIKEVSPETGKIIGASETLDTGHEMNPIEKKPDFLDKKPIIEEPKIRIPKAEYPFEKGLSDEVVDMGDKKMSSQEFADFAQEKAEQQEALAKPSADISEIAKEKIITEPLEQIQTQDIDEREVKEMLKESLDKTETVAPIEIQTPETPAEKINSILNFEKPDEQDLAQIKNIFQDFAENKLRAGDDKIINGLFANYSAQNPDFFTEKFGSAVTEKEIDKIWLDFHEHLNSKQVPTQFDQWQPRQTADHKHFFNVRKIGDEGVVKYEIDSNGNGKADYLLTENQLENRMSVALEKNIVKDISESK